MAQWINPGEIIKGDFSPEGIRYSGYFEKLYVMDVEKPGFYKLIITAEAEMNCGFDGRESRSSAGVYV